MWRPGRAGGEGVNTSPNIRDSNFQTPDAYRPADSYTLGYTKRGGKQMRVVEYDSERWWGPFLPTCHVSVVSLRRPVATT